MLNRLRLNATTACWLAIGILIAAMNFASAQGESTAAPHEAHHKIRYIIGAVIVIAIALFLALRKKSPPVTPQG